MKKTVIKLILSILITISFIPIISIQAQESKKFGILFTGIGCPHCAKVTPEVNERINDGELILIEYEIYNNIANGQILNSYADNYDLSLGIPQLLFNKELKGIGDTPIVNTLDEMLSKAQGDTMYLSDGNEIGFSNLNLNDLGRYPTIYSKDRVAVRKSITTLSDEQNSQIKNFIYASDIKSAINCLDGETIEPIKVETSAGKLEYGNAVKINGWILQWNGDSNLLGENKEDCDDESESVVSENPYLSIGRVITLGLADSVNPCALSILALVLIAIVTYNPRSRKDILLAGLAFILSVVVMYFIYGILIIKAFEVINSITSVRQFLYSNLGLNVILGIAAIVLGVLGLKDFFSYKPGSVGTEMPMFLRPKVSKLISKVTSPWAAFSIGAFVTLFLLPCTIGPYVILGGLLVEEGIGKAIIPLLLYDLIFVLPMIAVVIVVYIGSKKAEQVKDWRDNNVRYMHLVAGILMLAIGVLMVLGKF